MSFNSPGFRFSSFRLTHTGALTWAGEQAFSAGADLKSDAGKSGVEYWASLIENAFGSIAIWRSLNIPVIARVNGLAPDGGMIMLQPLAPEKPWPD